MNGDYRPATAWRMSYEDGLLVLNAGADRLYGLDGLDEDTAREVLSAWERESIQLERLSSRARGTVEELIAVGALTEGPIEVEPQTVAVRWTGEREEEVERHLEAGIAASAALRVEGDDSAGLLLYVRTTGRLVEVYDGPEPIRVPHLLLDLAYHHTVSLGPLVFAGETACLACLAGRIGRLWGDPQPPSRPAVLGSAALAAALAVRELEKVGGGDVRLANSTAAYDLDAHRVSVETIYKLPWCPVCGDDGETNGLVELPWTEST